MTLKQHKLAAFAGAILFVKLLFSVAILLLWGDFSVGERKEAFDIIAPRLALLFLIVLLGALSALLIINILFHHYVVLPARVVDELRIRVNHPNINRPIDQTGSAELMALISLINTLIKQRQHLQQDVESQIKESRLSLENERNRLATLMSELGQSVIVCNMNGQILLYNNQVRQLFRAFYDASLGGERIGLGRSIYNVLDRNLITHALENIQYHLQQNTCRTTTHFVTTAQSGQLLRVQVSLVLSAVSTTTTDKAEQRANGFVLMINDITEEIGLEQHWDKVLHLLSENNRASLTNIRLAVEALDYSDLSEGMRKRFRTMLDDEIEAMSNRFEYASTQMNQALKLRWSQQEMRAADLLTAAERRINQQLSLATKQEEIDTQAWINVDSFSLLQVLAYLASRLSEEFGVREVRFRLSVVGNFVHLDLIWSGQAVSSETVMNWELDPMHVAEEKSVLSVRDVIERHGGEMWLEREKIRHRAFFRILLPVVQPRNEVVERIGFEIESRPEYYDFDLFSWGGRSAAIEDLPLTELVYTVFDTETTGLDPSGGDEIIQIGATRIVNNKRLHHEFFEQLIDPLRPLSPESVKIHGITEEMVQGQPTIDIVLPAFHAFALDTILVAHNAAFDMRFLQLKQHQTGLSFDQPVLDTLLLSAVIHPNQASHRLEAIAERLDVTILGRHSAMGDAIVTAEVFLKMLPLLAEKGICTLRQAREAAEKTYYARIQY